MELKLINAFETREEARKYLLELKLLGVQYVRVKKNNRNSGRRKYRVYVDGKNSEKFLKKEDEEKEYG